MAEPLAAEKLDALLPVLREYHDAHERLTLETGRGVAARRERAERASARLTMALLNAGVCTLAELALRLVEERLRA